MNNTLIDKIDYIREQLKTVDSYIQKFINNTIQDDFMVSQGMYVYKWDIGKLSIHEEGTLDFFEKALVQRKSTNGGLYASHNQILININYLIIDGKRYDLGFESNTTYEDLEQKIFELQLVNPYGLHEDLVSEIIIKYLYFKEFVGSSRDLGTKYICISDKYNYCTNPWYKEVQKDEH